MAEKAKQKPGYSRVIIIVLILVAAFVGYLLYKSTNSGGGNSCSELSALYEKAKAVEDYTKVSEYFSRMAELGCK